MTSASERRSRIRVPVQSKIRHSQYQVLGTPVFQENSSIDISTSGIAFQTEREYKRGHLVLLEVQVDEENLKLLVCVAWVKTMKGSPLYEVGAELIAVDPVDKRKMQTHLNRLINQVQKKNKSPATQPKKPALKKKKIVKKTKILAKKTGVIKKKLPQKKLKKKK